MNVRRVEMREFTSHADTQVDLPETGIVLVTGANGAGKSSLVEAVTVAGWGKTLRGTDPWNSNNGSVRITADQDLSISRTKRALKWHVNGRSVDYESRTKAQDALESIIGPLDVWRRTHVFSSQDAAHFTTATDGERKRLLEAVLGLGCFDEALTRCRHDLSGVRSNLAGLEKNLAVKETHLAGERRRLADAERALSAVQVCDVADITLKLQDNEAAAETCESELRTLGAKAKKATQAASRARGEMDALERQLSRLTHDFCPTCDRPISADLRSPITVRLAAARKATEDSEHQQEALMNDLSEQVRDLEDALAIYVRRCESFRIQLVDARRLQTEHNRAQKLVSDLRFEVVALDAEVRALRQELANSKNEIALLETVDSVLGLKGVRAHVLGKALAGIEQVANAWLAEFSLSNGVHSYAIKLNPYSEKKTGGVTDAISIEVEGAGGGHGYKAASGGERRRIDVALLLALAEVADAASGRKPGTLFFDEVFDSLDVEGVGFVSQALGTLSKDRAVVVISHNENLASNIGECLHLKVDSGKITRA